VIRDEQGIGAQADLLAVQQNQLFTLFRHPHADARVDLGQIEGMQRLPQLEHHIVGDIHDRIDAADIRAAQALHHPQRCRL